MRRVSLQEARSHWWNGVVKRFVHLRPLSPDRRWQNKTIIQMDSKCKCLLLCLFMSAVTFQAAVILNALLKLLFLEVEVKISRHTFEQPNMLAYSANRHKKVPILIKFKIKVHLIFQKRKNWAVPIILTMEGVKPVIQC